jgi:hypothetical protein
MSSSKRATIPAQTFSKTATALDKLTGRASSPDQSPEQTNQDENVTSAEEQLNGNTVSQSDSNTVSQQNGNTVKLLDSEAVSQLDGYTVEPQDGVTVSQLGSNTVKLLDGYTVEPQDGVTVSQQNGVTVKPSDSNTVKAVEKTSFYLRPDQLDKLDELVMAYKRRTGKRGINRNDIIRHLIDRCELESLLTEDGTGTL